MTEWSVIVACDECGKGNPSGATVCFNCGHELPVYSPSGSDHIRPYKPPDASGSFVAQRAVDGIDHAAQVIQSEGLSPWEGAQTQPSQLSDKAIADAEAALGLKLPATLLAVLRIKNGGALYKNCYTPDSLCIPELFGIAPGCKSMFSLQQMPMRIWDIFEGYIDDMTYRSWRDNLGQVHPDWGETVRMPETILLVSDELHWGIGLNYIRCGRQGEPSVVHVEMEGAVPSQEILTEIAPDFLAFLRMLYRESGQYVPTEEDAPRARATTLLTRFRAWLSRFSGR